MLNREKPHFAFGPLNKTENVFFVAEKNDGSHSNSKKAEIEVESQEIGQEWKHTKSQQSAT